MQFGELIRERRAQMQPAVSLREMARRLDVSPSYVSDLETDRRRPSEALCLKIAAAYVLNTDVVMSAAGIVGAQAERYLKKSPEARFLLRLMADFDLDSKQINALIDAVSPMARKHAPELAQKSA